MALQIRGILLLIAAGAAIGMSGATEAQRQPSDATRTVIVSALDTNHVPVKGLQIGDFQIKEAGKPAEIVSVNSATAQIRVAVLDSDGGTGVFQLGALKFMQKLDGYAEFSLVSIIVQPITLVDYSTDGPSLSRALDAIGRRGNERGGQLMQAIDETTRTIRADGKRGVIVVLRIGGEETDASFDPETLRERLRKSDAILDVIAVRGANQPPPRTTSYTNQHWSATMPDLIREHLLSVLNDGSRESGGHLEETPPLETSKAVAALADDLRNQHAVTYATAPGAGPGDKLSVSTRRKGVTVFAPDHVSF